MTTEKSSEFAAFVREAGVRSVDRLSEVADKLGAPIRAVLRAWKKLSDDQKYQILDALMGIAQGGEEEEASEPAKKSRKRTSSRKAASKKR